MTTERNEWRPRYNNEGQNDEDRNRERKQYQSFNRSNYGNNPNGNYGGQDNRVNYNRPQTNYDRQGGNYNRSGNNNERFKSNDHSSGYDRRDANGYNSYNSRPQRNYDGQSNDYQDHGRGQGEDAVKKRRPRVGEVVERQTNAYSRDNRNQSYPQKPQQRGGTKFQQNTKKPAPNAKYNVQKQMKYREENFDPEELIRLNKYLANAGICSRREADEYIKAGVVKVNGEVVSELGTKVRRADTVVFHEQPVKLEHKIYVLLNKPKNCVTTADDPQERLTVMDLVKSACQERIVPVGRLDRNTTGVLLLTNDGDLASKLTHPKYLKKKIYHVWLDKNVLEEDMQKLADGIELEDGEIHADAISYVTETDKDQVGIEIHSGRNRIVRRMFESLGYHVTKLDRVYFAGLTKKNLKRGQWRYLNDKEVSMLRMGAFE